MKHKLSWILAACGLAITFAGLFFVLNYTSPTTAGPWGILLTFASIFLFAFAVIFATLNICETIYFRVKPEKSAGVLAGQPKLFRKRTIYVSVALAFIPLFLISLNSIGQLQLRDVFLILLFEALAIFYIVKRV